MKIFVSSLITGMELERAAVVGAVRALGHNTVTAETFGARPDSPQVACLAAVRESDCVVLVLGGRYGAKQPSGLSATHEEFREARDRKPVLVFIDANASREPDQDAFVTEVQRWQGGQFTEPFATIDELRDSVTRDLHRWELSIAAGAPDPDEMLARAVALLPVEARNVHTGVVTLAVAIAGGPRQSILRPTELETDALLQHLHRVARFGRTPIFVEEEGATHRLENHALVLSQPSRAVRLDEEGAVLIVLPLERGRRDFTGLPALIQEDVRTALGDGGTLNAQHAGEELLGHRQRVAPAAPLVALDHPAGESAFDRVQRLAQPGLASLRKLQLDHPPRASRKIGVGVGELAAMRGRTAPRQTIHLHDAFQVALAASARLHETGGALRSAQARFDTPPVAAVRNHGKERCFGKIDPLRGRSRREDTGGGGELRGLQSPGQSGEAAGCQPL